MLERQLRLSRADTFADAPRRRGLPCASDQKPYKCFLAGRDRLARNEFAHRKAPALLASLWVALASLEAAACTKGVKPGVSAIEALIASAAGPNGAAKLSSKTLRLLPDNPRLLLFCKDRQLVNQCSLAASGCQYLSLAKRGNRVRG